METGWLDFEQPIIELERKIEDLRAFATKENLEFSEELKKLEVKAEKLRVATDTARYELTFIVKD